jgi:hypothetical protein
MKMGWNAIGSPVESQSSEEGSGDVGDSYERSGPRSQTVQYLGRRLVVYLGNASGFRSCGSGSAYTSTSVFVARVSAT